MKEKLLEHMAKKICYSAVYYDPKLDGLPLDCPICHANPSKCIWPSFIPEAKAALEAVKDYAIVRFKDKPKI